jgi:hypothetical protein
MLSSKIFVDSFSKMGRQIKGSHFSITRLTA